MQHSRVGQAEGEWYGGEFYLPDMLVPLLTSDADLDGLLHEASREHDGIYNAGLLGGGHRFFRRFERGPG